MNRRAWLLLGFAVAVVAQLAVPAWMILEHEGTLRCGQVFKFKTQPVDPADAFRGRYVWLQLEPDWVAMRALDEWRYGQKAYAVLGTDTNGFATVLRLEQDSPRDTPAIPVRVSWADAKERKTHIRWNLDRYYMTEDQAPAAEHAYGEHNRRTNQTCHVTVRIRGQNAVIENLFIENQPIHAWLKTH